VERTEPVTIERVSSRARLAKDPRLLCMFLWAVSGASSFVGCSLFVSLDDLDRGDASSSLIDGSNDAPIPTDVALADAGADAGGDGDAATVCTGFCDNFDNRTTVLGAWDSVFTTGAGDTSNATITSAEFVSPTHALQFHLPARSSGASYDTLNLSKVFPLSGKVSVDVDVKIVGAAAGFGGFANLIELTVGGNYAGSATLGGGGNVVFDYWVNYPDGGHEQPIFDSSGSGLVVDTAWHHFHYDVVYDVTNGSLHATWDSRTVIDLTGIQTYGTAPVPAAYAVSIGYTDRPNLPAIDVYFDNVQVQ